MKKLIIMIPILVLISGCEKKEKIFEQYAKQYYENHMKIVNNINSVTITLEDLKNASTEDEYDLKKLEKCDKNSKVTFELNKTKEIEKTKIELKCK